MLEQLKQTTEVMVLWAEYVAGEWQFSLLNMVFKRDEAQVKENLGVISSDLLEQCLADYLRLPILLHIVGNVVLEKTVKGKSPKLSDILGVRIENNKDFILQVFTEKHHTYHGCAIRRNTLDTIFSFISAHKQRIISIYLGSYLPSVFLASYIPNFQHKNVILEKDEIIYAFRQGELLVDENTIGFESLDLANYLGKENISIDKLQIFAHLLLLKYYPDICTLDEFNFHYQQFTNQSYKTKIFQGIATILGIILSIFLIQYWYLTYQNYQEGELYINEQPQITKIKENAEKIKNFQGLQQQFTALNQSYVSWMMDKFAHEKPEEVNFSRCIFQPQYQEKQSLKKDITKEGDFVLEGVANHSAAISEYVSNLESLSFVQEVEVQRSDFNFQTELYEFSLMITCK